MLRTLGRSGNVEVFWTIRSGTFSLLTIAAIICLLSGCSSAQQLPADAQPSIREKKVLIVYLSRTNNTKAIAEFIHQKVGGTLVALELETPYPADYNATVQQVARENETGYLPPLKTKIDRIEQYDDFCSWAFRPGGCNCPPPVKSFLRQYSLKERPLSLSTRTQDTARGPVLRRLRELCPQSTVREG